MSRRRAAHRHRGSSSFQSPVFRIISRFVSVLVLAVVALASLFGIFWWLGDTLFPLKISQNSVFIYADLDGKIEKIFVTHFSVEQRRLVTVPIQGEVMVNVVGGYGEYQLAKVYPLLKLDKKNEAYIRTAFSWAMDIPVDQIVIMSSAPEELNKRNMVSILRSQLTRQGLHLGSVRNIAALYFFARSVPPEQVTIAEPMSDLSKLADSLDETNTRDCSVAVVNTTGVARLATRLGTMLENIDVLVVRLDDVTSVQEKSSIAYDPQNSACAAVAQRVQSAFPEKLNSDDQPELRQEYRADAVVVIGQDLGKLFVR